ncbi:MAG: HAD family hydrolase, partial [Chitinophagaceae bacterium]|nr:HAD family hydrolase [Chitinophagaceae bacterium]
MKKKAVFLDKDGTLIPDIPYNVNPELITVSDASVDGLRALSSAGYLLVVVTNQSGIARGYFSEDKLETVFAKLITLLSAENIYIDGFYYCPHHPEATIKYYAKECDCRKPLPGMISRAAEELNIDLSGSWMIGDIL